MILPSLVILAIAGLMIGSFLNVCIARLPAGESIVTPPSRCPSCRTPIRWFDNVPVVSYVILRGRCRTCHKPISIRYPAMEVLTAVAFVLQGLAVGGDIRLLVVRLAFTSALIVLFGTDLDTQRLPNVVTLPGIVIGLLCSLVIPPGFASALLGAALGAALLLAVRWTWKAATGTDGMGLGDVKMLAMIGAFLGARQVWLVLFLASLTGALLGMLLTLVEKRSLRARLPFGTFLAAAAFIASLVGEPLIRWYLSFY